MCVYLDLRRCSQAAYLQWSEAKHASRNLIGSRWLVAWAYCTFLEPLSKLPNALNDLT